MQRDDVKMLIKKWWDIYNDETLDYKKPVPVTDVSDAEPKVNLQPLIAAAMSEAAGTVHYVAAPSAA